MLLTAFFVSHVSAHKADARERERIILRREHAAIGERDALYARALVVSDVRKQLSVDEELPRPAEHVEADLFGDPLAYACGGAFAW